MNERFSCLLDCGKKQHILAYFDFKTEDPPENADNSELLNLLELDDSIPLNFNAINYLSSLLNISNKQAEDLLTGDVSSIAHVPSYDETDTTYTARYPNGTLLSGISHNCSILKKLNQLISNNSTAVDINRTLKVKFNPEFINSLCHVSARSKRKLRFKENKTLICTIQLNYTTNTSMDEMIYEYYLPESFNGTVLEYNKRLELDSSSLFSRPLDQGWLVLGLDTSKESGVYQCKNKTKAIPNKYELLE